MQSSQSITCEKSNNFLLLPPRITSSSSCTLGAKLNSDTTIIIGLDMKVQELQLRLDQEASKSKKLELFKSV